MAFSFKEVSSSLIWSEIMLRKWLLVVEKALRRDSSFLFGIRLAEKCYQHNYYLLGTGVFMIL